jgi:hypothetical protein
MKYEALKKWLAEHKKELAISGGGVLLFLLGYGTAVGITTQRLEQKYRTNYLNLTTQKQTTQAPATGEVMGDTTTTPSADTDPNCKVKGNISSKSKIYHVAGGRFYKSVKAEKCFNSEEEAKAAGFRKSSI